MPHHDSHPHGPIVLGTLAAFALACSSSTAPTSVQSILSHQAEWTDLHLTSYSYTYQFHAFNAFADQPLRGFALRTRERYDGTRVRRHSEPAFCSTAQVLNQIASCLLILVTAKTAHRPLPPCKTVGPFGGWEMGSFSTPMSTTVSRGGAEPPRTPLRTSSESSTNAPKPKKYLRRGNFMPNAECSRAGPKPTNKHRDALPASAGTTGWAKESLRLYLRVGGGLRYPGSNHLVGFGQFLDQRAHF